MSQIKWEARLSDNMSNARVNKDSDTGNYIIAFYHDRISNILPNWNIYSEDESIERDFNSFWGIIRDTLYEYNP